MYSPLVWHELLVIDEWKPKASSTPSNKRGKWTLTCWAARERNVTAQDRLYGTKVLYGRNSLVRDRFPIAHRRIPVMSRESNGSLFLPVTQFTSHRAEKKQRFYSAGVDRTLWLVFLSFSCSFPTFTPCYSQVNPPHFHSTHPVMMMMIEVGKCFPPSQWFALRLPWYFQLIPVSYHLR